MKLKLLTPAGWLWSCYFLAITLALCLAVSACANMALDARATALYGSFVVAESSAAELIQSPEVDEGLKHQIQRVDNEAKPAADALLAALLNYRKFKGDAERDALQRSLDTAQHPIVSLATVDAPEKVAP